MKILLSCISLLLLFSCSKNDDLSELTIKSRSPVDPNVYDGMLWFDDEDHILDYYYHLDTMISNPMVWDIDSMLKDYEQNFNYDPLRAFLFLDPIQDPEIRTHNNSVVDPIRQSIYNEDYEVRIGDTVFVKYSINQTFAMHVDSTALINKFRNVSKAGPDEIPWDLLSKGVHLCYSTKNFELGEMLSVVPPPILPRNPPFELMFVYETINCDPFRIRFHARMHDLGLV